MDNNYISHNGKNIVLIGFMGAGKTTVGKIVAGKLSRDFVDIDEEIEREFQIPTTEIFKQYGETFFRKKEKEVIEKYCRQKQKIISAGGGAFLQEEVRDICLNECTVFFLDLSWDSWKDRISLLIDSRPVLQGKSMDEIKALFYNRQSSYEKSHYKVLTDNLNPEETADSIIHLLQEG